MGEDGRGRLRTAGDGAGRHEWCLMMLYDWFGGALFQLRLVPEVQVLDYSPL